MTWLRNLLKFLLTTPLPRDVFPAHSANETKLTFNEQRVRVRIA